LLVRWDQATGLLPETIPVHLPPPRFVAEWSPEYPTVRRETIEAAIERLAGQIAAMLAGEGQGAMRLECRLACLSGDPLQVSLGLFQPTACAKHLFQLLEVQFERVRLAAPVHAIHLAATATAPLERRQQELFPQAESRHHPRHLAGLIDRLSNRLGRHAVLRARLAAESQPELAYQYRPLVDGSRRRVLRGKVADNLPPRPMRLLAKPVPLSGNCKLRIENCKLQIERAVPRMPTALQVSGQTHEIARACGPERIETGWWRGRAVGRDYYRVETTTGRRFWIFRDLKDGRWFLHGMFE
jgi:protein ImuB